MKKIRFKNWLAAVLLMMVFCSVAWAKKSEPQEKIAIPEVKYAHFKLENGLEIDVFEDHQVPLAEVNLWYKVGSLDEPEGLTGISHLLEHAMFLGTETLQKDQVHELVKQVGGTNNAYTDYYCTRFYEKVPAANLELALAIEADRMRNLRIDPQELRREQDVVMQERRRRIENDAYSSAVEQIQGAAFTQSSLHHEIIGWMEDINGLTPQKVQDYYDRYYAPNNAILSVCGDVSPQEVLRLAQTYFGDYQPQTIERTRAVEPQQQEEKKITVEKNTHIPYIVMFYKLPTGNHPDMTAVECLLDILVNDSASRANLRLKQEKKLMMNSGAWTNPLPGSSYAQIVLIPVAEDKIAAVQEGFDSELNRVIRNGVTDEELQVIKKDLIKQIVFFQRNINSLANAVMEGSIMYDDPDYYRKKIQGYEALTKEDIVRVAKTYFIKENRTVGYVVPQKAQTDGSKTSNN